MTQFAANEARPAICDGVFATWDDACRASDTVQDTFAGERWLKRMTQQLEDYRAEYRAHGTARPPRPTNLPFVAAMTSPHAVIDIDLGGSSGWWCWDYLTHTVPQLAIEAYTIVENERVVEYMTQSGLQAAPVTYTASGCGLGRCDLLYCNSVLQYFGSNAPLLDLVEQTTPTHILLDDLLAGRDGDWFSRQRNYDVSIPHRFIGLKPLLADLKGRGYRLSLKVPHLSPIRGMLTTLPMDNLPEPYRIRYASSLLFGKGAGAEVGVEVDR